MRGRGRKSAAAAAAAVHGSRGADRARCDQPDACGVDDLPGDGADSADTDWRWWGIHGNVALRPAPVAEHELPWPAGMEG